MILAVFRFLLALLTGLFCTLLVLVAGAFVVWVAAVLLPIVAIAAGVCVIVGFFEDNKSSSEKWNEVAKISAEEASFN